MQECQWGRAGARDKPPSPTSWIGTRPHPLPHICVGTHVQRPPRIHGYSQISMGTHKNIPTAITAVISSTFTLSHSFIDITVYIHKSIERILFTCTLSICCHYRKHASNYQRMTSYIKICLKYENYNSHQQSLR